MLTHLFFPSSLARFLRIIPLSLALAASTTTGLRANLTFDKNTFAAA
jgi:hypothetical protein